MNTTAPPGGGTSDGLSVRITNGDEFAWGDVIEGIVSAVDNPIAAQIQQVTVGIALSDGNELFAFASMGQPFLPAGASGMAASAVAPGIASVPNLLNEIVIADATHADVSSNVSGGAQGSEWAFALAVPEGVSLSAACRVIAHAGGQGQWDDGYADAPFTLLPPPFVQAVYAALLDSGDFAVTDRTDAPLQDAPGYLFTLVCAAPDALKERLNGVTLELRASDDRVTGTLEIAPHEHSFADHLRAFVHADRVRVPLDFPRAEVEAAGKAHAASRTATARFHELLDPFLPPLAV